MTHVISFTDGASSGNPGSAGWGAVMAQTKKEQRIDANIITVAEIGGAIANGTNNEAELTAAIQALGWAQNNKADSIMIYTDSSYLIDGATGWIYGWQKNGWTTQSGDSVKNQTLWKQIIDLKGSLSVSFQKVAGHSGIPANERADDIAAAFAADNTPDLFSGEASDYDISLRPESHEIPNAPVYLSCVDDVVKEHGSWKECKNRVSGKEAQFRKVHTKQERESVLAEWGKTPDDITE